MYIHVYLFRPSACIKAVVDGAVNELHKYNKTCEPKEVLVPDLISGDFDSINPDLLQQYQEKVKLLQQICVLSWKKHQCCFKLN